MAEPHNQDPDFGQAFARSVRTPRRPLRPGRRVWTVGLGMPALAAAGLAAVTIASAIEFGGDDDGGHRKPVAQAAPMQDKPVQVVAPGASATPSNGSTTGNSTDAPPGEPGPGGGTPGGGSAYPPDYSTGGNGSSGGASGGSGSAGGRSGGSAAGSNGTFGGGGSSPGARTPGGGAPGGGTAPAPGGTPGGSTAKPPVAPPAQPGSLAPKQTFTGTSGYGCANSGTSGFAEVGRYSDGSKGWYTVGSGGWTKDGCNGKFVAVPMSGDKNKDDASARVLWWFDVGAATRSCRLSVYVPAGSGRDVGGNPAQYYVLRGKEEDKTGAWYDKFTVDQVADKGRWVSAGTFPVSNGRIAVKLVTRGVDWGGTTGAHLAAGQVQASCTG
ncbi:hypothetical protein [Embleya scabrispora]|uniref:hypothetical protein n=1 Tax=Embleya scabrispora TaxID=159449 RepID=UPI00036C66AF|nr:hypothetical protein [Embleya scabrispora]MYS78679.1 hypothetical protein [Streptomyces sp. SID5474]